MSIKQIELEGFARDRVKDPHRDGFVLEALRQVDKVRREVGKLFGALGLRRTSRKDAVQDDLRILRNVAAENNFRWQNAVDDHGTHRTGIAAKVM